MTHRRPRPIPLPTIRPTRNARPRPTAARNVSHVRYLLTQARAIANERRESGLPPRSVLLGIELLLLANGAPWRASLDRWGKIRIRFPVPDPALRTETDHEVLV